MGPSLTGITIDNSPQATALACPFHPAETYQTNEEHHQLQLTKTPIKTGLDYIALGIKHIGPSPWQLHWKSDALALGFVHKSWSRIRIEKDQIEKLEPGQWFCFSGEKLMIEQTSPKGVQIGIVLCSRNVTRYLLQLDPKQQHPILSGYAEEASAIPFRSDSMSKASLLAVSELTKSTPSGIGHRLQLESRILAWVAEILNQSTRGPENTNSGINSRDRDAIEEIIRAIETAPGHEYSLGELAEIGRVNEHKLKLAFKHIHGKTPFTYLREVRMDHAAQLLREDRLSVIEVANEVGYSNASHFARAFKEHHSLLPKAYQCLHRD
ncbi:MAG: AraC family transcriptional regulator [Verrucomicrobiota bacterium]